MPGGKYAPCCGWGGDTFNSQEEMTEIVGGAFLRGEVPEQCNNACKPDQAGWRANFEQFDTDYKTHQIQFLDFRNNNLCNLKCRSCGPGFSTSWASEAGVIDISLYNPTSVADMDLSCCKTVYFAGGEPLLNPQHYEVLEKLIAQGADPALMYSTNMTVLGAKTKTVKDLWPAFSTVNLHASIDAVGKYAEIVRSGSNWETIEQNLHLYDQTPKNIDVKILCTVQALNIFYLPEFADWLLKQNYKKISKPRLDGIFHTGILHYPPYLSAKVLPKHTKNRITKKIYEYAAANTDNPSIQRLKKMADFMNSEDTSHLLDQTIEYIDKLDQLRHTDSEFFKQLI
jgi:sulfatase maturation enzyme AslB (radical SAM superfamily)